MKELRYTLLTDGSSDAVLIPVLTWLLKEQGITWAIQSEWADLGRLPLSKKPTLTEKIQMTLNYYPCDLFFIHRDAERELPEKRIEEIKKSAKQIKCPPYICVIPVRMQEAWLLFNEAAIRYAAGNRSERQLLTIPPLKEVETLPNPKEVLHNLLRQASGREGRKLKKFNPHKASRRVVEYIQDFSHLRKLSAFQRLEADVSKFVLNYLRSELPTIGSQQFSDDGQMV